MKTAFNFSATIFGSMLLILLFTLNSCNKDPLVPIAAVELSGTQTTPLVLEKIFDTPNTADYIVTGSWGVEAAVVVEPGVIIVMKAGTNIQVRDGGSLNAVGTASEPIVFRGESPTPGYWGYLLFRSNNSDNVLEHVRVQDGGGDNSWNASVYGYLNGRLSMRNTEIRNSGNYGFLIYSPEFSLDVFSSNNINGCALAPVSIKASHMGKIDNLSQFSNSTFNRIQVDGGSIALAQTWAKTQAPFFIDNSIEVNSDVSVSPGATVQVGPGQSILVSNTGSLNAAGTSTERITFTGASATNGSWGYILFNGSNNNNNNFQYVDVSYGGGDNSWNAAVYLYQGARFRMGNSSITNSQRWGLINYSDSNTFDDDGNNSFSGNESGDIGN